MIAHDEPAIGRPDLGIIGPRTEAEGGAGPRSLLRGGLAQVLGSLAGPAALATVSSRSKPRDSGREPEARRPSPRARP